MEKSAVILEGILILVVPDKRDLILFFLCDPSLFGHFFGGFDHGVFGPGIIAEIVPNPVLFIPGSSRAQWIGIINMRSVACPVTCDNEDRLLAAHLQFL
jgi:hypothetical protein